MGAITLLLIACGPAAAVDSITLKAGRGDSTSITRVLLEWDLRLRWLESGGWHLAGYGDLGLGYWHRNAAARQNDDISEIALTPVLRYQRNSRHGLYFEGSLGVHLAPVQRRHQAAERRHQFQSDPISLSLLSGWGGRGRDQHANRR